MNKYYYLVSSLVSLKFNERPPVASEAFSEDCARLLAPEDMDALRSARLGDWQTRAQDAPATGDWKDFDLALRKELAASRGEEQEHAGKRVSERVKEIRGAETPLLMERAIEKLRWDYIEHKKAGYFFDVNYLILYFLQLQILERLARFDKDKGEKYFYRLCEINEAQT